MVIVCLYILGQKCILFQGICQRTIVFRVCFSAKICIKLVLNLSSHLSYQKDTGGFLVLILNTKTLLFLVLRFLSSTFNFKTNIRHSANSKHFLRESSQFQSTDAATLAILETVGFFQT